jgi:hypothetical protein
MIYISWELQEVEEEIPRYDDHDSAPLGDSSIEKSEHIDCDIRSEFLGFEILSKAILHEWETIRIDPVTSDGRSQYRLISSDGLDRFLVGIDTDITIREGTTDLISQAREWLPCLDTSPEFEYIELFLGVDLFFSFFEILFFLLYDNGLTLSTLTDALASFIIGSGVFSWHREIIEKYS